MDKDDEIFKGKKFSDLLGDIYKNSTTKDRQIKLLIGELRPLIQNVGDATIIVPLIKEYLEVSVKNDDQLVKMAGIVQRLISTAQRSSTGSGDGMFLTEAEKKELLSELEQIDQQLENPTDSDIDAQIDDIREKLDSDSEGE